MQVSVENALTSVSAGVKDGSVTIQTAFCSDLLGSQK
jgi:hypothetical protein